MLVAKWPCQKSVSFSCKGRGGVVPFLCPQGVQHTAVWTQSPRKWLRAKPVIGPPISSPAHSLAHTIGQSEFAPQPPCPLRFLRRSGARPFPLLWGRRSLG